MTSAYHCGNCPNRIINPNDDWFCKVDGEELAGEIEVETTKRYGCASHPLAQAALREEGAKQERERVLKEFEEVIRLHDVDELLYADLYNEFLKIWKVQSLRGQHGKKD